MLKRRTVPHVIRKITILHRMDSVLTHIKVAVIPDIKPARKFAGKARTLPRKRHKLYVIHPDNTVCFWSETRVPRKAKLCFHAVNRGKKPSIFEPAKRLRRRIFQQISRQIHAKRQEKTNLTAHVNRRKFHNACINDSPLHIRKLRQTLIMIDKHKPALSVRAHTVPQRRQILRSNCRARIHRLHWRKHVPKVVHKQMKQIGQTVLLANLAVLRNRRLKIVRQNRIIVRIPRRLGLV